jgi:hypothetical protein
MKKVVLLFLALCFVQASLFAQTFWSPLSETYEMIHGTREIVPQRYTAWQLDIQQLKQQFAQAPMEFTSAARTMPLIVQIPMPNGTLQRFAMVEAPIMEQGLADQFPQLKTYGGQGIDDPYASIKVDFTDWGFHAMIISPYGVVFVDPYSKANTTDYISYFKHDYYNAAKAKFEEYGLLTDGYEPVKSAAAGTCIGSELRKYRMAVGCTGEYAVAVAGGNPSQSAVLSAITTTINRVDGVYETEVAVRLVLVATETAVIFTSASTDPYTGNNNANTLINESQTVITNNIGSANYDIGHTFSTGGGGLAQLGCVCKTSTKARGITGSPSPTGDSYDIDYVAHEVGHQFGGNHTFNSNLGSCSGNRSTNAAYEPGSGTTIMAYAGICGNDDIQPHSDPYFHTCSFDEIVAYTRLSSGGNSCPVTTQTGNNPPTVVMPTSGKMIPKGTPFMLKGTATDPDGDALTYDWEEYDLGASTTWNGGATSTTAPVFKSRIPKTSATRYFPDLAVINANFPANPTAAMGGLKGETLPTVARTMKFRLTVRDNRTGGGGVATGGNGCSSTAAFSVGIDATAGPFKVTAPNGGEFWSGGSTQNVTWNVASTTNATVNCQFVNIYMSTDGGVTYPTLIASHVANTGTHSITTPNIPTVTTVRFMIVCEDNFFFDVSDANFTITFNPDIPAMGVMSIKQMAMQWILYPNPATENLQVNMSGAEYVDASYEVLNTLGQVVMNGKVALHDKTSANISVAELAAGAYMIRFGANGNLGNARFIKQ